MKSLATLAVWFVAIAAAALAFPLLLEAWQLAPGHTLWCVFVGSVGGFALGYFEFRRRNDRVTGAKDRLDWLNRGGGTVSWQATSPGSAPCSPLESSSCSASWSRSVWSRTPVG